MGILKTKIYWAKRVRNKRQLKKMKEIPYIKVGWTKVSTEGIKSPNVGKIENKSTVFLFDKRFSVQEWS